MRRQGPGSSAVVEPMVQPAEQPAIDREQAEALHREIDRLPKSFRLPVVLCYFEGLTLDEAARRLRCPAGTLRSRLARARDKLRRGLTRRGVVLSAAALTTALAPRSASASISSPLCHITTRAALKFVAGQAAAGTTSASAMALAQEVLRSMLFHKLRFLAMTFLFIGAVATGAGYWNHSLAMKDEPVKTPAAQAPRPTTKPDSAAPGRMTVSGRVLDPDGKPVKGAAVDLIARPRAAWVGAREEVDAYKLLGQSATDGDGRFHLDAPRTASSRFYEVIALASAPGFGLAWAGLNPDAEQPGAELRLNPEQVVRVKLVDVNGMPAPGVAVRVRSMGRPTTKGTFDGVYFGAGLPEGVRTWLRTATSDDQGKLTLSGIGRDLHVSMDVRDLRYARQDLDLQTGNPAASKEISLALQPARIIEGRVLAADTGQPIPDAVVSATTLVMNEHTRGFVTSKFRADAQGRFQINPTIAGENYTLGAFPTHGEPYLIQQDELKWVKGAIKANHDIKLPRGVSIRGKVTEQGTGRPLAGSSVQFIPVRGGDKVLSGWQAIVATKDDGSYQIAVPPRKGHLLIFGPTSDYVLEEIGFNRIYYDQPGGMRYPRARHHPL